MRKPLSLFLALCLLITSNIPVTAFADDEKKFKTLNDPNLLQYVEDTVYSEMEATFQSDDFHVEDVSVVYLSDEFLEDLAYNSLENVYFGFKLSELDQQFEGQRYVFTIGNDGKTTVKAFEAYEDQSFQKVIKNVAIGTGVILVCVTVSVAAGGLGASTVSAVLAASASTGTKFALSAGALGGISSGIITGIQTGDFEEAMKSAAVGASEGLKWGAISGAVIGGGSKLVALNKPLPSPQEAEAAALKKYGGTDQVTYLGGKEVPYGTPGATRPDVVAKNTNGIFEAIEVKRYNLADEACRTRLNDELLRQVTARVENLPAGYQQRIVLNVEGRKFSAALVDSVIEELHMTLNGVYPNIPIDVMGAMV